MRTRHLGPFEVSAIGLGGMPMSLNLHGRAPDPDRAVATIHAALDAGVTLIDTADIYAPSWDTIGHNEELVARALREWSGDRDTIVVATKGGITRHPGEQWGRDASPDYLRGALEASLRRLGVETIDLYQWHRHDPSRDYAEVVATFARFRDEGKIRAIGISNADETQIGLAMDVLGPGGLASVQNEFSPRFRTSQGQLDLCGRHGIAFLPWSPLGGVSGGAENVGTEFPAVGRIARERGVSPQQVVLAWELAKGEHVIPIPGASRPESILDSVRAVDLELTGDEIAALDAMP